MASETLPASAKFNPPSAPAAVTVTVPKRPEFQLPPDPVLRFTPTAWAKLQFFCHSGDTEIGGFGIAPDEDLLLIEEFRTVHQIDSAISVHFDDTAVADFFEDQVDLGRKPEQFARIWLHTHPGNSPTPSLVDEETFAKAFGSCDWAIMFILARGGKTYCRLRFNVGPGASVVIPVQVDYFTDFGPADHAAWQEEFDFHVHSEPLERARLGNDPQQPWSSFDRENAKRDLDRWEDLQELRDSPIGFHEFDEVFP
jgi:proteasome lid subunit RPN8/RPN11